MTGSLPRVAAIHDLSCFGRSSLTCVIPALSALGCQVIPVPTALLSSQTDGFDGYFFRDLSKEMDGITAHFRALSLTFDAVYSGFLGSDEQVDRIIDFLDSFSGEKTLALVDPVLGDGGKLYPSCPPSLVGSMRRLCARAHVITPNYTEACFLADVPFVDTVSLPDVAIREQIERILGKLRGFTGADVVITGVISGEKILTFGQDDTLYCHPVCRLPQSYPGTGDVFASVLLGLILAGKDRRTATALAADFAQSLVADTIKRGTPRREGVVLEPHLGTLAAII